MCFERYLPNKWPVSDISEVVSRYLQDTGVHWGRYARVDDTPVENCRPSLRIVVDVGALRQRISPLVLRTIHCAPQDGVDGFLAWSQVFEVKTTTAPEDNPAKDNR